MGWLQTYCGSDPLGVLSPSVPYAFSACFFYGALQCWDSLLFLLVTPLLLCCLQPRKARASFSPPALSHFQQLLLAVLALLPLAQLLSTLYSHTASPLHLTLCQ